MKKITLMIVAAFVAMSSMATGVQKRTLKKEHMRKSAAQTVCVQKSFMANNSVAMFQNNQQKKADFTAVAKKSIRKADGDLQNLLKTEQSTYFAYAGGWGLEYPMYETQALVDGDGLAVQLNDYIVLEGTIGELDEDGYNEVTFKAGEVMAHNNITNEDYVAKAATSNSSTGELTLNDNDIIGYVFLEDDGTIGELFIASWVALAGETSGDIFFANVNMEFFPEEWLEDNVFVANITGEDYPQTQGGPNTPIDYTGKAFYYLPYSDGRTDILVQGVNTWYPEVWTCVTLNADQETAVIKNYQLVGTYTFNSISANADFLTCAYGAPDSDGYVHRVDEGLAMTVSVDKDYNQVFASDENVSTLYVLGYFDDAHATDYNGLYAKSAGLKIVITNEETTLSGINAVTASAKSSTNGAIYNLAGQRVSKDYKGIVIQNGVKRVQK